MAIFGFLKNIILFDFDRFKNAPPIIYRGNEMAAKKFAIAKQLGGKRIITNRGEEIGRLADLLIDENSGKIEAVIAEPAGGSKLARELARKGVIQIPYKAVFAVSDVIVVDENLLV